jgi:hypothetical protein
MFDFRRFRFRSPQRNSEAAERRFALIKSVVRSAVVETDNEFNGLLMASPWLCG